MKKSRTLAALRDTLLPKLLSGEVSVNSCFFQAARTVIGKGAPSR